MDSHALEAAPVYFGWRSERVSLGDGNTLALYRAGVTDPRAPAVVLVHGMGHWTQAAWTRLAIELAPTHRIVAFDLPGFGASSKPDVSYTLAYFSAALGRIVAHAGLDRFALVGHSLGGLIAADYASREPERVRTLGVIAPAGFLRTPKLALRVMASRPVTWFLGRLRPSRGFVRRTLEQSVYDPATIPATMADDVYRMFGDRAVTRAFARIYSGAMEELLHMSALHDRLKRWTGRVAIVWGREDRFVPIAGLALAERVFPQARVLVLERCGHCPAIEMPAPVAAHLVATGV